MNIVSDLFYNINLLNAFAAICAVFLIVVTVCVYFLNHPKYITRYNDFWFNVFKVFIDKSSWVKYCKKGDLDERFINKHHDRLDLNELAANPQFTDEMTIHHWPSLGIARLFESRQRSPEIITKALEDNLLSYDIVESISKNQTLPMYLLEKYSDKLEWSLIDLSHLTDGQQMELAMKGYVNEL